MAASMAVIRSNRAAHIPTAPDCLRSKPLRICPRRLCNLMLRFHGQYSKKCLHCPMLRFHGQHTKAIFVSHAEPHTRSALVPMPAVLRPPYSVHPQCYAQNAPAYRPGHFYDLPYIRALGDGSAYRCRLPSSRADMATVTASRKLYCFYSFCMIARILSNTASSFSLSFNRISLIISP